MLLALPTKDLTLEVRFLFLLPHVQLAVGSVLELVAIEGQFVEILGQIERFDVFAWVEHLGRRYLLPTLESSPRWS